MEAEAAVGPGHRRGKLAQGQAAFHRADKGLGVVGGEGQRLLTVPQTGPIDAIMRGEQCIENKRKMQIITRKHVSQKRITICSYT